MPSPERVPTNHQEERLSDYKVAGLEEIEELSDGRCPMRPVRAQLGVTSFGLTAWTGKQAGDRIINEHDESDGDDAEEVYLVQRGRARFEIAGDPVDAPTGTFVFVPANTKRTAFAEEPGTTIVAIGGSPGRVYEASGWELWMPANALYQSGKYEEAADFGKKVLASHPDAAGLLYNVACCESLAGRKAEALDHLRQAIERSERFREFAAGDSDFENVRGEPGFQELVGGT
jgi:tetratricopeptide (TPR) repeat protein